MTTETTDIAIFEGPGGAIEVRLDRETVWLTQRQMADLFDASSDNIGLHLKNIYINHELDENATAEDYSVVRQEGKDVLIRLIMNMLAGAS